MDVLIGMVLSRIAMEFGRYMVRLLLQLWLSMNCITYGLSFLIKLILTVVTVSLCFSLFKRFWYWLVATQNCLYSWIKPCMVTAAKLTPFDIPDKLFRQQLNHITHSITFMNWNNNQIIYMMIESQVSLYPGLFFSHASCVLHCPLDVINISLEKPLDQWNWNLSFLFNTSDNTPIHSRSKWIRFSIWPPLLPYCKNIYGHYKAIYCPSGI